jgi:glutamine cyclotransferase
LSIALEMSVFSAYKIVISYNDEKGTLLVTGKNWPTLLRIKLVPAN